MCPRRYLVHFCNERMNMSAGSSEHTLVPLPLPDADETGRVCPRYIRRQSEFCDHDVEVDNNDDRSPPAPPRLRRSMVSDSVDGPTTFL